MSVSAAEAGLIDMWEGKQPSHRLAPEAALVTNGAAERAGPANEPGLAQEIVEELPHLRAYAGFLTRGAMEKDDLVQDCLARALSRSGQFRQGTNLRRWLFTILRNIHIDSKRKQKRRGEHVQIVKQERLVSPAPQYFHLRLKEVEEDIRGLRPLDQEIIYQSVFLGADQRTIAGHMNIAVGTVKSRLFRARQTLRQGS